VVASPCLRAVSGQHAKSRPSIASWLLYALVTKQWHLHIEDAEETVGFIFPQLDSALFGPLEAFIHADLTTVPH
jgi:hypothetical protein